MLSWENYWPDLLRERIKEAGAGGRNIHVYEAWQTAYIMPLALPLPDGQVKQQWWMTKDKH